MMDPTIKLAPWVLIAWLSASAAGASNPKPARQAPLAYESSAFELAPDIPLDPAPWDAVAVRREIAARLAQQKSRRELLVDYYRIGHVLSFPLPLERRPTATDFPPGIPTMTYPWLIWLSWELEERWRILHAAWRGDGDREAGAILQRELAALATWDHFIETRNDPGLATAHIAACLAQALSNPNGWEAVQLVAARAAAEALVERDVWPWFVKTWAGREPDTAQRLVNIPVITLARAAQLARVIGSARAAEMEAKTTVVLRAWMRFRTQGKHHTEGTAYDGYLMDTLTEWLAALPDRDALLDEGRETFRSLADEWISLTLPGRFDLHAPIGDVEPEMTFWTAALVRTASWYHWNDAAWLLRRVPLKRLPAATLVDSLAAAEFIGGYSAPPRLSPQTHPHAVTMRSGWTSADLLAVVSLPRNPMGHLHVDAGHVVLGWQGRFWITDPGYQQYRAGDERIYTIGPEAHNPPVIAGTVQKTRSATLLTVAQLAPDTQRASFDLTACYEKLPAGARVQRDVWLAQGNSKGVIVRDTFAGLAAATEVTTHWLGGTHLAWAFVDGWARLSDGEHALWVGTFAEKIAPADLTRHVGSRGPLTLTHRTQLVNGAGVRWWIFWCDSAGSWTPPKSVVDGATLRLEGPGAKGAPRTFGR